MDEMQRFWSRVDVKGHDECWEWLGGKHSSGYGGFYYNKRMGYAHRYSYILNNGGIEKDMFITHSCDNRSCVNPNHLYQGSHKDNMKEMSERGRGTKGRKLSEEHKKKLSIAKLGSVGNNTGKKHSTESKNKMSESTKRWWENARS
jgi:hypothetical protein